MAAAQPNNHHHAQKPPPPAAAPPPAPPPVPKPAPAHAPAAAPPPAPKVDLGSWKPAEKKSEEAYAKYLDELTSLHQMVVYSMKAKQTTDLKNVDRLRALIKQFKASYLGT